MTNVRTISIDFDGVLHSYSTPWQNASIIPDPPVPGALAALWHFISQPDFKVVIFSSRNHQEGGIDAMRAWLRKHGLSAKDLARIDFPLTKPSAHVSIDDRSLRFNGEWSGWTPTMLREFVPWNRTKPYVPAKMQGKTQ